MQFCAIKFKLFLISIVFIHACENPESETLPDSETNTLEKDSQFIPNANSIKTEGEAAIPVYGEESVKKKIKLNAIIGSIVFSPDGDKFVSVSNDNIIRLWDIQGNLLAEMKGHSDGIEDVNFSHNGLWLASASLDKTVRLWDLKGNELMTYTGYGHKAKKAKFSNDDNYILSCSNDHTARLMPVSLDLVLNKINNEKVRGNVWELGEKDREVYGIK